MFDIVAKKNEYKQFVEKEYQECLARAEQGGVAQKEAFANMLIILQAYFDDMQESDNSEPYFDVGPIIDFFADEKDVGTEKKNYEIGCFIMALTKYGSTASQACMATGVFLGHKNGSKKTSMKSYDLFRHSGDYEDDMDAEQFINLNARRLRKVIDSAVAEFPDHVRMKKAREAYGLLLQSIEKNLSSEEENYILNFF